MPIMPTAELIRDSYGGGAKEGGYTELVQLMKANGHISGEVGEVRVYMMDRILIILNFIK